MPQLQSKKDRKHKRSKHSKHSKKERKRHSKKRKEKVQSPSSESEVSNRYGAIKLDVKEHFLSKQPEFRVWLYQNKGKCVSDVKRKAAKDYFAKFCKKWNAGELPEKFYTGIPQNVIDLIPRV